MGIRVAGFYEDHDGYVKHPGPGTQNFGLFINYNLRDSGNESKSAFGQVEVPITDQLTAVGGLRYTSNDNEGYWRDYTGIVSSSLHGSTCAIRGSTRR